MKKCLIIALMGLVLLGNLAAGAGKKDVPGNSKVRGKTIGFIIPGPDVYYNFGKSGVKWAVEASGNTYTERNSENNTVKEIQNVENLISAGVDVIILMTTDPSIGQKAAQLCNAAKIPIFLVDCDVDKGPGQAQGQVVTTLPWIGSYMGEYIVKNKIAPGGRYVILGGLAGQAGTNEQIRGFQEEIAKDRTYRLLSEIQYADWDRKKGEDLMRNYLVMHSQIDLVYAMNEEMAFGAATAIREAGRQNEMVIVSANGSAVGKGMIQAGTLLATTGWSPSENGILIVIKALEYLNKTPEKYLTETPLGLYHKDNLDKYPDWEVAGQARIYEPIFKQKGYWN
jgi:ribose transport system substrate-binding protein/inositol transport system substrate-binding protein